MGTPSGAVSGRVSVITLDPRYDGVSNQTVYIGAALGGVWRSTDDGENWSPLTDDQPSLAMGAIAIDPSNPDIIYAGTGEAHDAGDSYYGAGLLKSTDAGKSWAVITGPVPPGESKLAAFINAAFSALAIDPLNSSTIYAATQRGYVSSATGVAARVPVHSQGLWRSDDAGATWTLINPAGLGPDRPASDVVIDPRDSRRVLAAFAGEGIFWSANRGEPDSWEKATGLPETGLLRIKLAAGPGFSQGQDSTVYAAVAANYGGRSFGDLLGIFKSTDGGLNWTRVRSPQSRGNSNYNLALAVDPFDANILYYGTQANAVNNGGTLWRSRDGGETWTDLSRGDGVSGGLHADTHWIAISPVRRDTLFTANDGGVWRTGNATGDPVAWTNLNRTLSITQFYTIALHPSDPAVLLGGTQDNGTVRSAGDVSWALARGGDGGATLIDQSNPDVVYHTFLNLNSCGGASPSFGPEVSVNGGLTWTRRGCFACTARLGGLHPRDRMSQFAPMSVHPGFVGSQGNVLYFGTHRLYRSADQALTWTGLGASTDGFGATLTSTPPMDTCEDEWPYFLTAIAVYPLLDSGEAVWIGTGDGRVQVTGNAGALGSATFTDVTKPPLPRRYVTDLAVDPADPGRALVTYSGFNVSSPETPGHVFETRDQGAIWTDISGDLPDLPVNSIALDPLVPGAVYVGTDLGVFRTSDGGKSWIRFGNGMPMTAVFMLRYHASSRSLIAATHGRGVFRLPLNGREPQ
jgi:photosystem II stability/assembly factor-like uncharacterized protein